MRMVVQVPSTRILILDDSPELKAVLRRKAERTYYATTRRAMPRPGGDPRSTSR